LIEDARALLEPGFAEKLTQDVLPEQESSAADASDSGDWEDVRFDFGDLDPEPDFDPEEQTLPLLTFREAALPLAPECPRLSPLPMRDSASPETRPRCRN
jgi:hypothetical protein